VLRLARACRARVHAYSPAPSLLHCISPDVAQSVNLRSVGPRPKLVVKPTSRLNARPSQFDPCRKPRFFDGLQLRCRDHPNLNGPNPGAANPNGTGFLPAVGGRLSAGSTDNLSDADCSSAFTKQFSTWNLGISGVLFPPLPFFPSFTHKRLRAAAFLPPFRQTRIASSLKQLGRAVGGDTNVILAKPTTRGERVADSRRNFVRQVCARSGRPIRSALR
jgi:hypothetical protein